MKGKKKHHRLWLIAAVTGPGILISLFGIHFLSQQKAARIFNLRNEIKQQLTNARDTLEEKCQFLIAKAFANVRETSLNLEDRQKLMTGIKSVILVNPIIQYPFIYKSKKGFIFPWPQKTSGPIAETIDKARRDRSIKSSYETATHLEMEEKKYSQAIHLYLQCRIKSLSRRSLPHIFNAIARCYYKMNQYNQAMNYYQTILKDFETEVKEDITFYVMILRQLAQCHKAKGTISQALMYYFILYEQILQQESFGQGDSLIFYKNEALDFINQHARKDLQTDSPENDRAIPKWILTTDQMDINLQWLFIELENPIIASSPRERYQEGRRLLKIEELYMNTDDKTWFYQQINNLLQWKLPGKNGENTIRLKNRSGNLLHIYWQIISNQASREDFFFGFMISPDFLTSTLLSELGKSRHKFSALQMAILPKNNLPPSARNHQGTRPFPLISVPFKTVLTDQMLWFFSPDRYYINRQVKKEIWINYSLMAMLMVTLLASAILFYRYINREAELIRLKADFVDRASHTLKTPLTRMALLAENLNQGWVKDKAQQQKFITTIVQETQGLNDLVNNLLNFSRIEAGKKIYHFTPESLQNIIGKCLEKYMGLIEKTGFQFKSFIDHSIPPIPMDAEAVTCALANLIHNAIKYSTGEKYLEINLKSDKYAAIIEVTDRGIGIAKKEQAKIFDKYYRINDPTVNACEGSGLGLYLVKHVMNAHKGKIKIDSRPGTGSTFCLVFPHDWGKEAIIADKKKEVP